MNQPQDNKGSDVPNLSELSSKIAQSSVQATDAMTAKYLEEVVRHITERGDKIEDYTLYLVSNPMETIKDGLRVSMQYRVGRVDELQDSQDSPMYRDWRK